MIFVKSILLLNIGITKEARKTSEKFPLKFDKARNRCLLTLSINQLYRRFFICQSLITYKIITLDC